MTEIPQKSQVRIDELLRQASDNSLPPVDTVLAEAKRGLADPSSLSLHQIRRVCFAVVAMYAGRGRY